VTSAHKHLYIRYDGEKGKDATLRLTLELLKYLFLFRNLVVLISDQ